MQVMAYDDDTRCVLIQDAEMSKVAFPFITICKCGQATEKVSGLCSMESQSGILFLLLCYMMGGGEYVFHILRLDHNP